MKVDLNPEAVSVRLRQVEALRRLCLSLALSSAGLEVAAKHPGNKAVRRTSAALGRPAGTRIPERP